MQADYVFINGSVVTVDQADRVCQALAVAGDRIVCAGTDREILGLKGPRTEVVDLQGRSLLPGLIDAHCHPGTYGNTRLQIRCTPREVKSIEDIKRAVAERAETTPKGGWIIGRGYDQTELAEKRHPNRHDLDAAAPDHKVVIWRTCGHVLVVNSLVLREVGYDRNTSDPAGGRIDREPSGEPSGVLFETARVPVWKGTFPDLESLKKAMPIMNDEFLGHGITSVQDAGGRNPEEFKAYQLGLEEGWLKVRVYFMARISGDIRVGEHFLASGLRTGFGCPRLRLGALKLMIDGSIGGESAAVRQAYPRDPANFGITYMSQEELDEQVWQGHLAGYQVGVHAIGDQAVDMTLTAFERALKRLPRVNHRHRIEHCGLPDEAMMDRMASLGVVPVLGVPFIYQLGDSYLANLGPERLKSMYPLRSLMKRGLMAPLSSDAPVIDPNPMHGIYAAVTRRTRTGQLVGPEEKVDLLAAIRAYTLFGAFASFEENRKGSLEPGKLADLTVLSGDILKAAPEEILGLEAQLTMVGGEKVFRAD